MADWVAYELRRLRHALAGKNVIDDMRWPNGRIDRQKMCEFEFFTDPPLAELGRSMNWLYVVRIKNGVERNIGESKVGLGQCYRATH